MSIHFWELVCFSIFVALVFKPTRAAIINGLNQYSSRIKTDIDDSCKIKTDAVQNLDYYSKKHKELTQLVREINESTKLSIKKLEEDTKKDLENKIDNKTFIHKEMIKVLRKDQLIRLKLHTIQKAISISERYLLDNRAKWLAKENLVDTLESAKTKITFH